MRTPVKPQVFNQTTCSYTRLPIHIDYFKRVAVEFNRFHHSSKKALRRGQLALFAVKSGQFILDLFFGETLQFLVVFLRQQFLQFLAFLLTGHAFFCGGRFRLLNVDDVLNDVQLIGQLTAFRVVTLVDEGLFTQRLQLVVDGTSDSVQVDGVDAAGQQRELPELLNGDFTLNGRETEGFTGCLDRKSVV